VTHTGSVVGTFTYTLDSVRTTGSALCVRTITGQTATITVNALPTASLTGAVSVCQNAASPNITFTGANGTAPYTFTYNINGGPNQTITSAGNIATINASTAAAGTFIYNLVSVQDASSSACSQAQTGSVTIIVSQPPTANITGTTS